MHAPFLAQIEPKLNAQVRKSFQVNAGEAKPVKEFFPANAQVRPTPVLLCRVQAQNCRTAFAASEALALRGTSRSVDRDGYISPRCEMQASRPLTPPIAPNLRSCKPLLARN